jgi:hypothetical protein
MTDSDRGGGGITKSAKGLIVGAIFIAWGVIGALMSYVSDSGSFDIIQMVDASDNAIVHAVIWIAAGTGIVAWYWMGPGASRRR